MAEHFIERRQVPRVKAQIATRLHDTEFEVTTCAHEISQSGVYAQIDRKIAPMTKMELTLMLPIKSKGKTTTKRLHAKGIAVRVEPAPNPDNPNNHNVAILFTDISVKDKAVIEQYISSSNV